MPHEMAGSQWRLHLQQLRQPFMDGSLPRLWQDNPFHLPP
jgi:hypothetical protein